MKKLFLLSFVLILAVSSSFGQKKPSRTTTTNTTETCKTSSVNVGVAKATNETCVSKNGTVRNTTCVSVGVEAGGKVNNVGATVGAEVRNCTTVETKTGNN